MARFAVIAAVVLVAASARASDAPRDSARDCALGFLAWCVLDAEERTQAKPSRLRLELFAGYKPSIGYYELERRNCEAAGCHLRLDGPLVMADALVRLWGNPLSDDYFDLGLSYASIPVLAGLRDNGRGFEGELGPVAPGDGDLSYAAVRLTLRRPSLLYLVRSKYLISSFGVGLAFPIANGAGRTFTGAGGPKLTIGGRLGVQVPLTETFSLGLATSYGVIWYGPRFDHAAYVGGYGLNLQWLL